MSQEICVVVGAGPGVGLAVAKRFGREGFKVALVARKQETLDGCVAEMKQAGTETLGFAADASDFASLKNAFAQIKAQLGDPTVLVYNAAVLKSGVPSELASEDLINNFVVNVAGALISAQQVIPAMKAKKQGTILFTGGGLALYPSPQYASLAIGKAGIRNLAYSLGAELEPDNIQVATVTIAGMVQPGTHFDPDLIAETYWQLHQQPANQKQREVVYK